MSGPDPKVRTLRRARLVSRKLCATTDQRVATSTVQVVRDVRWLSSMPRKRATSLMCHPTVVFGEPKRPTRNRVKVPEGVDSLRSTCGPKAAC